MTTTVRWEPVSDLVSLRDAVNRLFEESFIRPASWLEGQTMGFTFPMDMYETPNEIFIKAVLPGVNPEFLDISVTGDVLTIKAETKGEKFEGKDIRWHRQEVRHGAFARTVTLPTQVVPDKIEATFEHGILTLVMPKMEHVKPRTIKVKALEAPEKTLVGAAKK